METHEKANQRKFKCKLCDKKFNRNSNLKEHLQTHSNEQKHECKFCKKLFATLSSVKKHLKDVHEGIKKFSCPICAKLFSQNSHLKKHIASIHETSKVCEICNTSFRRFKAFENHMKVHENEEKLKEEAKPLILSNEVIVESRNKTIE